MNDPARIPAEDQRDSLRARIEAAERRNADRTLADDARAAAAAAVDYTRAHPLTVIGGALALGLTIGLMTRPGRQMAQRVASSASGAVSNAAANTASGAKNVAARGSTKVGGLLGEAMLGYVMTLIDEALDTARAGQERAEELGDAASGQARKLKDGAVHAAETAAENSRTLARKTRAAAQRAIRDLARKTKG